MAKREYFRRTYNIVKAATSLPNVDECPAPDGCEIHYQRIICRNGTTTNTEAYFEAVRSGKPIMIGSLRDIPTPFPTVYDGTEIVMQGTEYLRVRWVNTSNGDNLMVTVEGYLWKTT